MNNLGIFFESDPFYNVMTPIINDLLGG